MESQNEEQRTNSCFSIGFILGKWYQYDEREEKDWLNRLEHGHESGHSSNHDSQIIGSRNRKPWNLKMSKKNNLWKKCGWSTGVDQ